MKRLLFFIFIILSGIETQAQYEDAQLWENISLEKRITSDWAVTMNEEGRITNNISQFHYVYDDAGICYKFNKRLKFSADYVFVWKETQSGQSIRHQWYLDFTEKNKFHRLELEWRCMFQQQVQDIESSDIGDIPDNYLRDKFTLKYSPLKFPWYRFTPYLCTEIYYRLSAHDKYGRGFNRNRYFAGLFYNFNKKTALEVYYMIEYNFNINNPPLNFVTGVGFSREL